MGAKGRNNTTAQIAILSKRQAVRAQSAAPRTKKISRLAIEVETTCRTEVMHLGEAPINGRSKNSGGSASRTELGEDAAQRRWTRIGQEQMIVDTNNCVFVAPGIYSIFPEAGPTAVARLVLGSMPIRATPPTPPRLTVTTWPRARKSACIVSGRVLGTERLPRLARS
jgi:hypothetical protein